MIESEPRGDVHYLGSSEKLRPEKNSGLYVLSYWLDVN